MTIKSIAGVFITFALSIALLADNNREANASQEPSERSTLTDQTSGNSPSTGTNVKAEGDLGGEKTGGAGQPPISAFAPVQQNAAFRNAQDRTQGPLSGILALKTPNISNTILTAQVPNAPVQTSVEVTIILWGSQWCLNKTPGCNSLSMINDPSKEIPLLQSLYPALSGSTWLNSVTQYCTSNKAGATAVASTCTSKFAGKAVLLNQVVFDTNTPAPAVPTQAQVAAVVQKAAAASPFLSSSNNINQQFVVLTATRALTVSPTNAFGGWCAYHSYTSVNKGTILAVPYVFMPYTTDAGSTCGAGFNGLPANAGITVVAGHELAEAITDPFLSAWQYKSGVSSYENGDLCAWVTNTSTQGPTSGVLLSSTAYSTSKDNTKINDATSNIFALQSLWSDNVTPNYLVNGKPASGCVLFY